MLPVLATLDHLLRLNSDTVIALSNHGETA